MLLSDRDMRARLQDGSLRVEGWTDPKSGADWNIRPASMLLHLGREFRMFNSVGSMDVDPDNPPDLASVTFDGYMWMPPGGFLLGHTVEMVTMPADLAGQVDGRSSLARLGLQVHQTAGHIDPGFSGQITLELHNVAHHSIKLRMGMAIVKMGLIPLSSPAERPYGSAGVESVYQGQAGATSARTGHLPAYDKHEPPPYPAESLEWPTPICTKSCEEGHTYEGGCGLRQADATA